MAAAPAAFLALDDAYRAFVAAQPGSTVWHEAALLEALAGADRRVSAGYVPIVADGQWVGVWPYYRKTRLDGWTITLPPLARYCGPLFRADWLAQVGHHFALGYAWSVLPKGYRSFDQSWPLPPDALPPAGELPFRVRSRTTHHLDLVAAGPDLERLASKQMRYDLRRAARHFTSSTTDVIAEDALDLLEAPYRRQGGRVPYTRDTLRVLAEAMRAHQGLCCVRVVDHEGQLQSTGIFLRDQHTVYALLTGVSDAARPLSGGSFALSRGIAWAQESRAQRFDFLGSDTPGIADNFRRLGGVPTTYSQVYQDAAPWTKALRAWRA